MQRTPKEFFEAVLKRIVLPKCPPVKCLFSGLFGVADPGPGRMVAVEVGTPARRDSKLSRMSDAEWEETVRLTAAGFNAMHGMTVCDFVKCGLRVSDDGFKDQFMRTQLYLHPPPEHAHSASEPATDIASNM
jgi:hypothetical protein